MPGNRELILDFIRNFPGRDDDEIAATLRIRPRQQINQICRKLATDGLVKRMIGPSGKIINFPQLSVTPTLPAHNTEPEVTTTKGVTLPSELTEDHVKRVISAELRSKGWSVEVAWGRTRGIDIAATKGPQRWIIECKGIGSLPPMQNNYFVGVIGEIAQRMSDEDAKHSIAFPDHPKFRRLWSELPPLLKRRLQLTAVFVSGTGTMTEVD